MSHEDRANRVSPNSFARTVVSKVTVFEYSAFSKVVKAKFGQNDRRTKLDRTFHLKEKEEERGGRVEISQQASSFPGHRGQATQDTVRSRLSSRQGESPH